MSRKENIKLLNEVVRWSSNKPIDKTTPSDLKDPFGEDGRHIMENTPPKKDSDAYLLGVISRALGAEIKGQENNKHSLDVELFLYWFAEKTVDFDHHTDQDIKNWIDDWLVEGRNLLIDS